MMAEELPPCLFAMPPASRRRRLPLDFRRCLRYIDAATPPTPSLPLRHADATRRAALLLLTRGHAADAALCACCHARAFCC